MINKSKKNSRNKHKQKKWNKNKNKNKNKHENRHHTVDQNEKKRKKFFNTHQKECDGASETSRTTNYELHGTGWATRVPFAQTLQKVRQTRLRTVATCLYPFARFPSCGIFTPARTSPVKQRLETTG